MLCGTALNALPPCLTSSDFLFTRQQREDCPWDWHSHSGVSKVQGYAHLIGLPSTSCIFLPFRLQLGSIFAPNFCRRFHNVVSMQRRRTIQDFETECRLSLFSCGIVSNSLGKSSSVCAQPLIVRRSSSYQGTGNTFTFALISPLLKQTLQYGIIDYRYFVEEVK